MLLLGLRRHQPHRYRPVLSAPSAHHTLARVAASIRFRSRVGQERAVVMMLRNIGSNWVLIFATIAATYVLTPFIIRTLGQDGYGTWTLITAMTGYMSLLALGVPMASVRYLAQDIAEGDTEKMNKTIGTCVGLYLIIGAAALLVGAALTLLFALVFEVPASFHSEA